MFFWIAAGRLGRPLAAEAAPWTVQPDGLKRNAKIDKFAGGWRRILRWQPDSLQTAHLVAGRRRMFHPAGPEGPNVPDHPAQRGGLLFIPARPPDAQRTDRNGRKPGEIYLTFDTKIGLLPALNLPWQTANIAQTGKTIRCSFRCP
jgi:hypothetical protein